MKVTIQKEKMSPTVIEDVTDITEAIVAGYFCVITKYRNYIFSIGHDEMMVIEE